MRLKNLRLIPVCCLILLGNMLFHANTGRNSAKDCPAEQLQHELAGIRPVKDNAALATTAFSAAAPQVISLRTQQFQQQTQGRYLSLHGLRPKNTARPRQANKVTTTFCRRNIYPVDYFIYFLQEILI